MGTIRVSLSSNLTFFSLTRIMMAAVVAKRLCERRQIENGFQLHRRLLRNCRAPPERFLVHDLLVFAHQHDGAGENSLCHAILRKRCRRIENPCLSMMNIEARPWSADAINGDIRLSSRTLDDDKIEVQIN